MPVNPHTFQGTTEYRVKVWDVATWKEQMSLSFPQVLSASAILSSDGHRLAIERSSEIIELVDADSGSSLGILAGTIPQSNFGPMFGKGNLAFSPDATWKLPRP